MNFSAQYFYTKGNKASFSYVQDNWVQKLRIYLNGKLFFTWSYMLQIPSISKEYFVLEICLSRSHQYIWFSCYCFWKQVIWTTWMSKLLIDNIHLKGYKSSGSCYGFWFSWRYESSPLFCIGGPRFSQGLLPP